MSAFIKFTPLCTTTRCSPGGTGSGSSTGARADGPGEEEEEEVSAEEAAPELAGADWHCYLLELDEVKVLLDCGWTETCPTPDLDALARVARQVDAVLLSHSSLPCLGAYSYAAEKLGLTCPVYATTPVHDLGQQAVLDLHQAQVEAGEFTLFSAADVETSFKRIIQLRYSQPYALFGKCKGIVITAHAAGHSMGATIWSIRKDTDHIVYAVDYNHRKEGLVNGAVLHLTESLARPSLLITDSRNALQQGAPTKRELDASLAQAIAHGLAQGAQILLPTDTTTRALELAYVLDALWSSTPGRSHIPLFFLAHEAGKILNILKSSMEWMGDAVAEAFTRREIPFSFRHLQFISTLEAVEGLGAGPKLVLASCPGMEVGFSRLLFQRWSGLPNCLLLLPDPGLPGSLKRTLYEEYVRLCQARGQDRAREPAEGDASESGVNAEAPGTAREEGTSATSLASTLAPEPGKSEKKEEGEEGLFIPNLHLDMQMLECHREPLEGEELRAYLEANAETKEEEYVDSDEEEEGGEQVGGAVALDAHGIGAHAHFDTYLRDPTTATSTATGAGGSNSFFKQTSQFKMFPITITGGGDLASRVDDYGQAIDPAAYMKGEYQFAIQAAKEAEELALAAKQFQEAEHKEVIPTKYVSSTLDLQVCCLLYYLDYTGTADGTSIKNILPQVSPRKLVLVSGTEASHAYLRSFCLASDTLTHDVFLPCSGETLNVSSVTNIYQIKLTDSLVTSLSVSSFDDYQLSYVGGLVVAEGEGPGVPGAGRGGKPPTSEPDLEQAQESGQQPSEPGDMQVDMVTVPAPIPAASTSIAMLDVLPPDQQLYHTPLMIGDLRLSEFRQVLQGAGFATEFIHGHLFVNGAVLVKKLGGGKLGLEGALSADYFKVRALLYEQHAIL